MFEFGLILAIMSIAGAIYAVNVLNQSQKITALMILGVTFLMSLYLLVTPESLIRYSGGGTWLIIDRSDGKIMRHWIIKGNVASDYSDGYIFADEKNNVVRVSRDSLLIEINEELEAFMETYRERYNIPEDQKRLR